MSYEPLNLPQTESQDNPMAALWEQRWNKALEIINECNEKSHELQPKELKLYRPGAAGFADKHLYDGFPARHTVWLTTLPHRLFINVHKQMIQRTIPSTLFQAVQLMVQAGGFAPTHRLATDAEILAFQTAQTEEQHRIGRMDEQASKGKKSFTPASDEARVKEIINA